MFHYMSIRKKSVLTFFALFFIAVFAIGGCNDNNNGGGGGTGSGDVGSIDPNPDTSACAVETAPCTSVTRVTTDGVTYGECVIDTMNCAADLSNVVNQVNANGINVTNSSTLWIELWGANGGGAMENGGGGGSGGYAQFTSTVSDFESAHNGVSTIYYFLGGAGGEGNSHCGGGGGASSIVTLEDVTLNPTVSPDESLILMIAGGGGAGGGGTQKGCTNQRGVSGADGGTAIAGTGGNLSTAGDGCNSDGFCNDKDGNQCQSSGTCGSRGQGGGTNGDNGGIRQCCINKQTWPTNGVSGLGGEGGSGGRGKNCNPGGTAGTFRNATLSFSAGRGGNGGGGGNDCTVGGGGGGGGHGGGGGGALGNEGVGTSTGGGGGGSFSVASTKSSTIAPSSKPGNPCGSEGCIVINVIED